MTMTDAELAEIVTEKACENELKPAVALTKREYLAACAMQGLLSNSEASFETTQRLAVVALEYADHLLTELARP
jgi:hypothetical protein